MLWKTLTAVAAAVVMFGFANSARAENTIKVLNKDQVASAKAPLAASAGTLNINLGEAKTIKEASRGGRGYCGYGRGCYSGCYSSCYNYCYSPCYSYDYCYTPCYSYGYCYTPCCYSYCYRPRCCYYSCCGSIGTLSGTGVKATEAKAIVERTEAKIKLPASLVK